MNEFTQILITIRRPFRQETRNGCQDNVVINGLGSYVKLWLEKARQLSLNLSEEQTVDKLADCFENYDRLLPTDRLKIIEDATAQINTIVSQQSVNPPIKTRTIRQPRAQSREPTEELCPSQPPASHTPVIRAKEPSAPPLKSQVPRIQNPLPNEKLTIADTPVETDIKTLDFLATLLEETKGIGTRRAKKLIAELDIRTRSAIYCSIIPAIILTVGISETSTMLDGTANRRQSKARWSITTNSTPSTQRSKDGRQDYGL